MNAMLIGIAGGSGAGKSTLAHRLAQEFGESIVVLCEDSYYRNHDNLSPAEKDALNFDHPDAIETELLIQHLKALRAGQSIRVPIYDFATHSRRAETHEVLPRKVIVVEGILLFHPPELRELFDLKVFVDADADERLLRRIQRDTCERGRDVQGVIRQYLQTVKPMHQQFVEPTKKYADILLNGGLNDAAYELLATKIREGLASPIKG